MFKRVLLALCALALATTAFAASLLPNGKQQFVGSNGQPLAGGSVTFYIPGTTTPKTTWKDSGQSQANTNPIILDSLGSAIIYGSGNYRQVVRDRLGNIVWDQLTADTAAGASNTNWAGTSSGTANAQTVIAPNFTSADGQALAFVAGYTNTGPMTLIISGASPLAILKDTTSGPVPLSAGDVVAGNVVQVTYVVATGALHTSVAAGSGVPTGTLSDFAGSTAPAGWLLAYGQAISRTTYSSLFAVIGTQYGAGDGSTTFNVPDTRGRVIAANDNLGGSAAGRLPGFTSLGASAGTSSIVLSMANLPSATLTGTAYNIADYVRTPYAGSTALVGVASSGVNAVTSIGYSDVIITYETGSVSVTLPGSSSAVSIVQPTISMSKIIKF